MQQLYKRIKEQVLIIIITITIIITIIIRGINVKFFDINIVYKKVG